MIFLYDNFPLDGIGFEKSFQYFSTAIAEQSAKLDSDVFFAHMDPPTPEIASALVGINAKYNQNLLHPDLSPFATLVEKQVIEWLKPAFGMACGHMCGGSTLGNLTALWAAREAGARRVIASVDAHLSIPKSAHILGLEYTAVQTSKDGSMDCTRVGDVSDSVLVLTAGTTGRGAIDPLVNSLNPIWTHVDAAWAGPLIYTKHANILDGIKKADSVAVSSHKWFYQPKDSALVFFKSTNTKDTISFGGSYLTTPNVGIQGSRSASAIPLMATLLAWGKTGLATRIENDMANAFDLANLIAAHPETELNQMPATGVFNWRPTNKSTELVIAELKDTSSRTIIDGEPWLRQVSANPKVDVKKVFERILDAVSAT